MLPQDAAIALKRFGLGPRPGDVKRIATDPRGYVFAQLTQKAGARLDELNLAASATALREVREAQRTLRVAKLLAGESVGLSRPAEAAGAPMLDAQAGRPNSVTQIPARAPESPAAGPAAKPGALRREYFREEAFCRITRAAATDAGLIERLVMFWSNHFCVSVAKGQLRALAGAYEREAIRPHVLGRFSDMLNAVERHPAMLIYLDQAESIGPNSIAGQRRAKGLNENLAREILELHTLGADGGYTQTDVTNFARVLTGWTVAGENQGAAEPGTFLFAPLRHEPGRWTVLGKTYGEDGVRTGYACLADFARHPATARHIARKLAAHFVSHAAPPELVAALEKAFRDSDGDLAQVTRTLVTHPAAWAGPAAKVVPPYDFAVAIVRGYALAPMPIEILRSAAALGQPLWQPPAPKGWPDQDDSWMGPSPMRERLRLAERAAREISLDADPRAIAADLLGPAARAETLGAVRRAETRDQAFALLVMSPDFMRR